MAATSICILRLSAIGDVCHAIAVVERIQRRAPHIALTWVIGKVEYQLVKDLPGVNFIVFDKSQGLAAYRSLRHQLQGQKFDILLAMQVALRANLVAALIPAKQKIGYDWARSKELHWLFTNSRIASHADLHVLDSFMAFADAAAIPPVSDVRWHLPVPIDASAWVQDKLQGLAQIAVISPAASKAERNWLPQRYAAIAEYLHSRGLTPVLCGGPATMDRELGEAIQASCGSSLINLIGQTNLKQLLALLQHARLVIAPDTGPAHMATIVGTPVIGLYAHSNPRRTGPYNDLEHVVSIYDALVEQQYHKPWHQLPWGTRVKGEGLMTNISVEAVQHKIDKLLETRD